MKNTTKKKKLTLLDHLIKLAVKERLDAVVTLSSAKVDGGVYDITIKVSVRDPKK